MRIRIAERFVFILDDGRQALCNAFDRRLSHSGRQHCCNLRAGSSVAIFGLRQKISLKDEKGMSPSSSTWNCIGGGAARRVTILQRLLFGGEETYQRASISTRERHLTIGV